MEVRAQSSGGSQDGLVDGGLALVRGSDPDGVNPVLGVVDFPTSQAINLQTTSPWQVLTAQFYPGQLQIQNGDYLVGGNTWLQIAAIQ